jgi:hypothetical protein
MRQFSPCLAKPEMVVISGRGDAADRTDGRDMPSLLRLLLALGILFGLAYGTMLALVTFVDPKTREITVTVPPDRFVRQQR